jgi:hypothetical protein
MLPTHPHLRSRLTEELLVQKSLERRWRELVGSIAPEAARQDRVFNWLQVVIMQAISSLPLLPPALPAPQAPRAIAWDQLEIHEGQFPPQYEQSLDVIARNS